VKKIFLHYKYQIIVTVIFLTIVQAVAIYFFNFQREGPYFKSFSNIFSCFNLLIAVLLPALITYKATRESLLDKVFSGWKLGLYINSLLIVLSIFYAILDWAVKQIFFDNSYNDGNILAIGYLLGAVFFLITGICTGWITERICSKKEA
jgi:hypothetical protein